MKTQQFVTNFLYEQGYIQLPYSFSVNLLNNKFLFIDDLFIIWTLQSIHTAAHCGVESNWMSWK